MTPARGPQTASPCSTIEKCVTFLRSAARSSMRKGSGGTQALLRLLFAMVDQLRAALCRDSAQYWTLYMAEARRRRTDAVHAQPDANAPVPGSAWHRMRNRPAGLRRSLPAEVRPPPVALVSDRVLNCCGA